MNYVHDFARAHSDMVAKRRKRAESIEKFWLFTCGFAFGIWLAIMFISMAPL